MVVLACVFALIAFAQQPLAPGTEYEVVISNGRVMDPESGLDAVRHVGISGGKIRAVSEAALRGKQNIDARGLVVAPGFIDLHSHGQDDENYSYKAMDGVTTALELEIGVGDIQKFYAEREGKVRVNFGATVGHVPARMRVFGEPASLLPRSAATTDSAASPMQIAEMQNLLTQGLDQGALGVGMGIQYVPGASHWEVLEMFRTAARAHAPVFVHVRNAGAGEPMGATSAVEEVIAAAAATGAPLHIVHISSIALSATPQLLQIIGEARAHGLDVTTECYPYTAAQTDLSSAVF